MTTKHTPGPWKIRTEELYGLIHVYSSDGWIVKFDENGDTNARLIAAAPDLLDVAMSVLDHASVEMPQTLIAAARSAVSKATAGGDA